MWGIHVTFFLEYRKMKLIVFTLFSVVIISLGCKNKQEGVNIETIKTYTSYNAWANDEFITWLKKKDTLCLTDSVPSSFSSIKETLTHLWGAEIGWLQTLKGEEWNVPKDLSKTHSIAEILEGFSNTTRELKDYIEKLNSWELNKNIKLSKGEVKSDEILIHILNHASYHRGQIVTMARNLKITNPPRTDFIYYVSNVK